MTLSGSSFEPTNCKNAKNLANAVFKCKFLKLVQYKTDMQEFKTLYNKSYLITRQKEITI